MDAGSLIAFFLDVGVIDDARTQEEQIAKPADYVSTVKQRMTELGFYLDPNQVKLYSERMYKLTAFLNLRLLGNKDLSNKLIHKVHLS